MEAFKNLKISRAVVPTYSYRLRKGPRKSGETVPLKTENLQTKVIKLPSVQTMRGQQRVVWQLGGERRMDIHSSLETIDPTLGPWQWARLTGSPPYTWMTPSHIYEYIRKIHQSIQHTRCKKLYASLHQRKLLKLMTQEFLQMLFTWQNPPGHFICESGLEFDEIFEFEDHSVRWPGGFGFVMLGHITKSLTLSGRLGAYMTFETLNRNNLTSP